MSRGTWSWKMGGDTREIMTDQPGTAVEESKLTALNKKIVEIKKKIQLSEGQRKANFEESNARKREYIEKLGRLKKEVKELYVEYVKAKNKEEIAERASLLSRESSAHAKTVSVDETLVKANEDNIRLRKNCDLMRYRREKLQENLAALMYECNELERKKRAKSFRMKTENPLKDKIIDLEVRLERMRASQIKVDIARRKFKSVYTDLKEKSVSYASSLLELEDSIREQEAEISRLRAVKEEAIYLRDSTQETLEREETEAATASEERDRAIQDYRQRVAEKRAQLERLERTIFPARSRDHFEGREKGRVYEGGKDDVGKDEISELEEKFARLRVATGVSRSEDVPNRFLGQREIKERLRKMRAASEEEKIELERQRQELTAEVERQKFTEAKNTDRNAETVEQLAEEIREERARGEKAEAEEHRLQELLNQAIQALLQFSDKIPGVTDSEIYEDPQSIDDPSKLTELLVEKINLAIETRNGLENTIQAIMTDKFDAMSLATTSGETRTILPENVPLFPCFPSTGTPAAPSEDEEEVLTRNALKRRAQVLVDAKSRRKGFNFKR